jgi:hypothetical protein
MVSLFCFMLFATFVGSDFAFAKVDLAQQRQSNIWTKHLGNEFSLQEEIAFGFYTKLPCVLKMEKALPMPIVLKNDKDFSKVNSYAKLYAENFLFHNLKTENEIQRIQNI